MEIFDEHLGYESLSSSLENLIDHTPIERLLTKQESFSRKENSFFAKKKQVNSSQVGGTCSICTARPSKNEQLHRITL